MNLQRFDPRQVQVKDKRPSIVDQILMSLIQGSLTPDGRQNVDDVLNEMDTRSLPENIPEVPGRPKTRKFGNASFDDWILSQMKR